MNVVKQKSESEALRELLNALKAAKGVTQGEFAKRNKIPGGASMISQHLSENRPINLEQAISYATGFEREGIPCSVSTISPRLFDEIRKAASLEGEHLIQHMRGGGKTAAGVLRVDESDPAVYRIHHPDTASRNQLDSWPFENIMRSHVEKLSDGDRRLVEAMVMSLQPKQPSKHSTPEKKSRAAKSA